MPRFNFSVVIAVRLTFSVRMLFDRLSFYGIFNLNDFTGHG